MVREADVFINFPILNFTNIYLNVANPPLLHSNHFHIQIKNTLIADPQLATAKTVIW